ncbi:MAG TPA: phage tail sheath subtilisin-like domain-containing protein [Thermoanaerobaculia bacterium]|jgi:hypothetical protein|nr:phage tail sheath subtilisin-like domain-containing protein [Thermoanaerobaculia bacterium]
MPPTLTYPGVYVEEIPSGVRTITGVATSIAAFCGFAPRGPIDKAVTITSWADYERIFGGLVSDYPLSYAVRDFYENGGATAIIVRTYKSAAGELGTITKDDFKVEAASPGMWAKNLRMRVESGTVAGITDQTATDVGVTDKAHLYNLTFRDTASGETETFNLVTSEDTPRRVDRVLASSRLVKLVSTVDKIPTTHVAITDPAQTWTDDTLSSKLDNPGDLKDSDAFWSGGIGTANPRTGLYLLDRVDLFNILCLLPEKRGDSVDNNVWDDALNYCVKRRAMLIVDPRHDWDSVDDVTMPAFNISGTAARNAAIYFPRVLQADAMKGGMIDAFPPCGMVAGIMARTDETRGVWKAPAGIDAGLYGAAGLSVPLNDGENGQLNPLGVNCLRTFPIIGNVVWGARTMRGANLLADEYKYVPVRRLALFLEESLFRGLQWVVFEPNDEPLWSQIRLNVGAFMHTLFRQGAFQGGSPRDAYFVACDKTTTTQNDINLGIVNIIVGFAPLKPAEFVVLKIQQMAGQIQT